MYSVEKIASNKIRVEFKFPVEEVSKAYQNAYLSLRGKVSIPGFRRGKAPRVVIERMYGKDFFAIDAQDTAINKAYGEFYKENMDTIVGRPELKSSSFQEGEEGVFVIEVFIQPDVILHDLDQIEVSVPRTEVTEEMIQQRIDRDRRKLSRTVEVTDRGIQNGDQVELSYAGTIDGVAFEGGSAENYTLTIGSNTFIPGFESQMVGLCVGDESDLPVTFPKEYSNQELAGKNAVFHVVVHSIHYSELPEMDDDFASDVSEFSTFGEYRENIVSKLKEETDRQLSDTIVGMAMKFVSDHAEIDIPDIMVEDQARSEMESFSRELAMYGMTMKDYLQRSGVKEEQMLEMFRPNALERVKNELCLLQLAKEWSVNPSDEEILASARKQGKKEDCTLEDLTAYEISNATWAASVMLIHDKLKELAKVTYVDPQKETDDDFGASDEETAEPEESGNE